MLRADARGKNRIDRSKHNPDAATLPADPDPRGVTARSLLAYHSRRLHAGLLIGVFHIPAEREGVEP